MSKPLNPVKEDHHTENIILGAMAHQMTGGKAKDMRQAKLPFNLDTLCTIDFSFHFETLKQAIQYLANQQGHQQMLINELLARPVG